MLYAQAANGPRVQLTGDADSLEVARSAVWLDLLEATAEERHFVASLLGQRLPERADLEEIETSSRLAARDGALFMSLPLLTAAENMPMRSPLGLVLTERQLVTIRFATGGAFEVFDKLFDTADHAPRSGPEALLALMETMVDRLADALERVGATLDGISHQLFGGGLSANGRAVTESLKGRLRQISREGDLISGLRDILLGLSRVAGYVPEAAREWVAKDLAPRFATLRTDLSSLADYETRLQDKTQFLLDATLGFINIEQNDIFRVLTVVSVVGIPPTLVAGIYGMNFKNMPELEWPWGYAYGLAIILLSALIPLWWFRRRGWV